MRYHLRWTSILALTLIARGQAFGYPDGVSGYSGNPATGGGDCMDCHSGGVAPTVNMSGPMTVLPGATNTYQLVISGGQKLYGGLDVSATAGTLASADSATHLDSGEVTQSRGLAANASGNVTFNFKWTAPATAGACSLYGVGLSSNGSGTRGDNVGLISMVISVAAAPAPNQLPVADAGGPYSALAGAPIAFNGGASYDPDGTIATFAWKFGDGATGTGSMPSHAFASAGSFTVTLTVTDNSGATGAKQSTALISAPANQPPVAHTGGPYSGKTGAAIAFNGATSMDPDGTIASFAWDFGDGSTGTGSKPSHAYAAAGTFNVTLLVTDNSGLTDNDATVAVVTDVVVTPPPPPPVDPTPDPAPPPPPPPAPDPAAGAIALTLHAPATVQVTGRQGQYVRVVLEADLASLAAGTTGCGKAFLTKNGKLVGQKNLCLRLPADGVTPATRVRRVKTATGVRIEPHASAELASRDRFIQFDSMVGASDGSSVEWDAHVEFDGQRSDAAAATTQLTAPSARGGDDDESESETDE